MNLKEYEKIIAETAIYPKEITQSFGLAYCMLGLNEEFQEFLDAETANQKQKELGDVIWYVTAMCTEINTTISQLAEELENDTLKKYASADYVQKKIIRLSGKVKKYYRDNVDYSDAIKEVLKEVLFYITVNFNNELSEILSMNYTKLIKRRETNTLHGEGDNREEQV